MAALLRKVDSLQRNEVGRRIARSSSPIEQTPQPKPGTREEVGSKIIMFAHASDGKSSSIYNLD